MAALGRVAHRDVRVDAVAIATADSFTLDVPGFDQVGHDPLSGSLGDSNVFRDVTEPCVRVAVEEEKDLGVVREEPPRLTIIVSA